MQCVFPCYIVVGYCEALFPKESFLSYVLHGVTPKYVVVLLITKSELMVIEGGPFSLQSDVLIEGKSGHHGTCTCPRSERAWAGRSQTLRRALCFEKINKVVPP